jgi:hypothetical protein
MGDIFHFEINLPDLWSGERFEKCSIVFKFKEDDPSFNGINYWNTL